jgi:hypothetical protein
LLYGFWLPLWYLQTLLWKRWLHITCIKCNFRWHWGWILGWKWQLGNIWRRNIVCFTILLLPVLLDEEYWSFRYCV